MRNWMVFKEFIRWCVDWLQWMLHRSSIYWWSDIIFIAILINIDFINIYCHNCLYIFIRYSYEVLTHWNSLHISVCCCFVPGRYISLGFYFIIGCLARNIWLVVICERGNLSLFDYPLASSKPQVTGDVSPGPHLPKQKEPSYRGDIG